MTTTIDWNTLPHLTEDQARSYLAADADQLATHDPVLGAEVDIEVLAYQGARQLPPGRYENLVIPDIEGSVYVDGDIEVSGVLEQPFRAAPVFIRGNLRADHLVTTGCLVVMGNVTLAGVFYGNCTNYCTHVYGSFTAKEIILEKNHHFALHGEATADLRLDDEEHGSAATEAWMNSHGVDAHDETALAAALRATT